MLGNAWKSTPPDLTLQTIAISNSSLKIIAADRLGLRQSAQQSAKKKTRWKTQSNPISSSKVSLKKPRAGASSPKPLSCILVYEKEKNSSHHHRFNCGLQSNGFGSAVNQKIL